MKAMRRILLLFVVLFFALSTFGQSRFTLNLNAGCDSYSNKYYSPYTYQKFENADTDYNFGMDIGYRFSDIFRMRMEFKYLEFSYGHNYLSSSDLLKSEMTLTCLDFNPRLDFRIFNMNQFELFLSTGLRLEYAIDSEQESLKTDGTVSDKNYISMDYNDKMSGLIGGAILKYNFSKHLGLTLSPEYTLFFDKLYYQNSGSLQRFSMNGGLEWTF